MSGLDRVAVVGAGQVGTMIGSALIRGGAGSVAVFDLSPERARAAVALGAAHLALARPEEALEAEAVVLAIPVDGILSWLESFGSGLRSGQLLVDTGSAKLVVVVAMALHLPASVAAVGGHPMAGNEGSGPEAASLGGLDGAAFILTPCRQDLPAVERARRLVELAGAVPVVMEADTHDRLVARTSHLPHLLAGAAAMASVGSGSELEATRALVGPGYRSLTRLAAGDPAMVASFLTANREQLRPALAEFRRQLDRLEAALDRGQGPLQELLGEGRAARELVVTRA